MTTHNTRLLDLYTDYLLTSFGAATATGMASLLPELSHDQITRLGLTQGGTCVVF